VVETAPPAAIGNMAWAPHYYDAATLMTKSFSPWLALDAEHASLVVGESNTRALFERAGKTLLHSGRGLPVLVGETGWFFSCQSNKH
jgi:hypothetical protein